MAKKPRKPEDGASLIRALRDLEQEALKFRQTSPSPPVITGTDEAIGNVINSLLAPTKTETVDQSKDAPATIEELVERLARRQEALAAKVSPAVDFASVESATDAARVTDAMSRIQGTIAHELRSLSVSEQQILLKRLSIGITNSLVKPSSAPVMPLAAPEQWEKRQPGSENPVQFVRRVYAAWLGRGLSRRQLRNLDPALYRAFSVWTHRHPEDAMAELPSMSEQTDSIIEVLSHQMTIEELRRLGYAIDQRIRRGTKSKTK